jgi:hypothetical protein
LASFRIERISMLSCEFPMLTCHLGAG